MTVVAAFNWLDEIIIVADSRVSWNGKRPPEDVLIKLHIFNDARKAIVIGFAGDLQVIKTVMVQLNFKFEKYSHRFVLSILKDKVRRWIEEVTLGKLRPGIKRDIKFILCGMERSCHPEVKQDGLTIGHMPWPQMHFYEYTINCVSGKVQLISSPGPIVIGSGAALKAEIIEAFQRSIKFGFNLSALRPARALIVTDTISLIFKDSPQSPEVGGPFHYICLTPDRLQQNYVWPSDGNFKNFAITKSGTKTILYNSELNKTFTLNPVWEVSFLKNGNLEV